MSIPKRVIAVLAAVAAGLSGAPNAAAANADFCPRKNDAPLVQSRPECEIFAGGFAFAGRPQIRPAQANPPSEPAAIDRPDSDGRTALHRALAGGGEAGTAALLARGANPNLRDNRGQTPLMVGIAEGRIDPETAAALLRRGADPDPLDAAGDSALALAIADGRDRIVALLLERGARTDTLPARWPLSGVPRLEAETVGRLLDAGAPLDFSALNRRGQNAIHLAVMLDRAALLRRLLAAAAPADAALPDVDGRTPLDYAREGRQGEIAALLEEFSIDPDEVVDQTYGLRRLHRSAREGNADEVARWIRLGADLESRTDLGRTPLMWMASNVFADNWTDGHDRAATALLQAGAQADATDPHGESALHKAAFLGNPGMIEILLNHNADPRRENNYGQDVMHSFNSGSELGFHRDGLKERARNLLERAIARVDGRAARLAALRAAVEGNDPGEVHRALFAVRYQDRAERDAAEAMMPELMRIALDNAGERPFLHAAVQIGEVILLATPWDRARLLNSRGSDGGTILHRASAHYAERRRSSDDNYERWMGNFAAAGADPELVDDAGRTPLVAAIEARQPEVVRILLEIGAEITEAARAAAEEAGGEFPELLR